MEQVKLLRKMPSTEDIGRSAAQKLRELFARATDWQEIRQFKVGMQTADLLVKFNMGEGRHTLVLETTSLGQPREIRGAIARLTDFRRDLPNAYPLAVSEYISPQSATLLRRNGLGYLDLSGNCYLSFDNVLIEKEGKPNLRPSTRPLKSLFAPRATRVDSRPPGRSPARLAARGACQDGRGEPRACAQRRSSASRSCPWVQRGGAPAHRAVEGRGRCSTPGSTRIPIASIQWAVLLARADHPQARRGASPGRRTRRAAATPLRCTRARLSWRPTCGFPAIHCYLEGDPEPVARALGLRPGEGEGNVYLMSPYDQGVFHAPIAKGGLPVVCLPQLYADLYHYERRGREQAAHLRREAMGY